MQGVQLFGQVIECQVRATLSPPVCLWMNRKPERYCFVRQCSCPSGWVGKHCEKESPCKDSPCHNGGTCYERDSAFVIDGELPYACRCQPGYNGSRCELHSSVWCGACCNGMKNCTNGTSTMYVVCSDEASPVQVRLNRFPAPLF